MDLWKKPYTLRRYGEQELHKGYSRETYSDMLVYLNVQTTSSTSSPTEDGKRERKTIRAFSNTEIKTDNVAAGTKADRIKFGGEWYECTGCTYWEHTPLAHYEAEFVRMSESIEAEAEDDGN